MTMRRAFTLMELMVVVGIMSFLGVAAVGGYNALQRGMAERGATAVATSLLQAAKERAMIDRVPTVVYCYNRLVRAATDDENAIVVGEAVAVRRAGRVTWARGDLIADEFADLASSYDVVSEETDAKERKGMKLWRFDDDRISDMRYSVVADAVVMLDGDINGTTYRGWALDPDADETSRTVSGQTLTGPADLTNFKFKNSASGEGELSIRAYAFVNLKSSKYEPSTWTVGDGYGFEFANVQLPNDFVFGGGNVPSQVGDVSFVRALYFDPDQPGSDASVDVYFCRPDSGGNPKPDHKAGTATSQEDAKI